jgi:hypothetical protein
MQSATWEQALSRRMTRHHLVDRAPAADLLRVVSDICGLHAQLMSSAELSLWARTDGLERDTVADALWRQRTLVKLWAMRGTLHLLPASELGLWLAGLSTITNRGMTGHPEIDALTDAVGRALRRKTLTREELAEAVGPEFAEDVRFSWGSYLKPASFRGLLCFAEGDAGRVRYTSPAHWLSDAIDRPAPEDALRAIAHRFVFAYGPCSAHDLGLWFGVGTARGRRMLESLGDDAVELDVDGERLHVLARDVPELAAAEPPDTANLLPAFDPWIAGASRTSRAVLEPRHRTRVYRPQGWFSPVLLVNGKMVGVWKHTRKGRRLVVELEPFGRLARRARAQLESEAERLAAFLDCKLDRVYGSASKTTS